MEALCQFEAVASEKGQRNCFAFVLDPFRELNLAVGFDRVSRVETSKTRRPLFGHLRQTKKRQWAGRSGLHQFRFWGRRVFASTRERLNIVFRSRHRLGKDSARKLETALNLGFTKQSWKILRSSDGPWPQPGTFKTAHVKGCRKCTTWANVTK